MPRPQQPKHLANGPVSLSTRLARVRPQASIPRCFKKVKSTRMKAGADIRKVLSADNRTEVGEGTTINMVASATIRISTRQTPTWDGCPETTPPATGLGDGSFKASMQHVFLYIPCFALWIHFLYTPSEHKSNNINQLEHKQLVGQITSIPKSDRQTGWIQSNGLKNRHVTRLLDTIRRICELDFCSDPTDCAIYWSGV